MIWTIWILIVTAMTAMMRTKKSLIFKNERA
jgi:hypothetical protein